MISSAPLARQGGGFIGNNSMVKSTPGQKKCAICRDHPADKTNSHIIPNFFLTMVSSVDGSYRRGKELLYTIGDSTTKAHLGSEVLEHEWSDSFDHMSEERIEELKKNAGSEDFIFCSRCERRLGEYLESPWHDHMFKGRKISPETAYFFWVSVLWRISFFEGLTLKLPHHIEESLRKRLLGFILANESKSSVTHLIEKPPFYYKVLYSKDYSKNHPGFVYYEYDKKSHCATLLLGDIVACFAFAPKYSFKKCSFYGLEKAILEAPLNNGMEEEKHMSISPSLLDNASEPILQDLQKRRLETDRSTIYKMWDLVRQHLIPDLPISPDLGFVSIVINHLYDENVKNGERITHEYFVKCFRKGLEECYRIPFAKR